MSEVKFPPRVGIAWENNQHYLHWTDARKDEPYSSKGMVHSYISQIEHESKISQLEERLRVAEQKNKEAAWSKQEEIGMRCKQNGHMRDYGKALIEEVRKEREELAAIKEKK